MKRALSIGINAYPAPNRLRNCVNDAKRLGAWAQDHGATTVQYLLDGDATKVAMVEGLRWLVSGPLRPGDVLLAGYSGHGAQVRDLNGDEPDGKDETAVPVDFDFGNRATWFTDDEVHTLLARYPLPAGVTLLVNLDCCHAGTMLREFGAPPSTVLGLPRSLSPMLATQTPARGGWRAWVRMAPRLRRFGERLLSQRAVAGSWGHVALLAATQPTQLASDGMGSNGAHTEALLDVLRREGNAPLRAQRVAMQQYLLAKGYRDQTPTLYGDRLVRGVPFFAGVA